MNPSTDLDRWPEISIPISRIASMASGFTRLGAVPALNTSKKPQPTFNERI
jgi:hypothetical protein